MAEYAGYVASQPVDFGKIGSGLVSNLIAIQEKKAEYDERKQLALEKKEEKEDLLIDRDTQKIQDQINKDISSTGSQNLQRVSGQLVSKASNAAAQLGRLAKVDRKNAYSYNQKAQSLARSVGSFRQNVDAWAKGSAEIIKLSAGQDLDALGEAMAKDYIEAGDLNGVDAGIANEEKVVFYKKDPETGEIIVMDPEVYTDYNRFVSKKIDYNKLFDDFATNRVGEWEVTKKGGPLTEIDSVSVMNNPSFKPEKEKFKANIKSTPFSTIKFLTSEDPSYQIYRNESEKKQLIDQGFDEKKLIKLGKDASGYPVPIVTDGLKAVVDKLVDEKIQATVSLKTTKRRDPNIIINTPKEPKDLTETEKERQAADRLASATVLDIKGGKANSSNIKNFILGLASDYDVDPKKSKLIKMPNGGYGIQIISTSNTPNTNFGKNGIITSYEEIVPLVPKGQVNRVLISDQKKSGKGLLDNINVNK